MRPEASYVLGPESCLFVGLPATQGEACGRLCWGCRNAAWLCSIPEVIGGQLLVHIAVTPLPEQALLQVAGSLHTQIGAFNSRAKITMIVGRCLLSTNNKQVQSSPSDDAAWKAVVEVATLAAITCLAN